LFLKIDGYAALETCVVITFQALADGSREEKLAQWFKLNSAEF
jgi:hypothetical protein